MNSLHWTLLLESIVPGDRGLRRPAAPKALLEAGASTRPSGR